LRPKLTMMALRPICEPRRRAPGVAPDGVSEHDEMVMVEVLTESFDRPWWRGYAATLAQRFSQRSIHIRVLPAEVP
jgi:hypothetical protein